MDDKAIHLIMNKFEEMDKKIDGYQSQVAEFKDEVLTKVDAVYKELQNFRQEQTVHQLQHDEITADLDAIKSIHAVAHQLKSR